MLPPPDPVLVGAARWLHELQDGSTEHAFSVLTSAPQYRDVTPTQYGLAHTWLRESGLLDLRARPVARDAAALAVLKHALEYAPPPWLKDAEAAVSEPGELPEDLLATVAALELPAEAAFTVVRALSRKFDAGERARVGAWGEEALCLLLERASDGRVDHIAGYDDTAGFDIAWRLGHVSLHIEVKTTTRRGRLVFYLSRNEFEVAAMDPSWRLAVVLATPGEPIRALAAVSTEWLVESAPSEHAVGARWESAVFEPPPTVLLPGLGGVVPCASASVEDGALLTRGRTGRPGGAAWLPED